MDDRSLPNAAPRRQPRRPAGRAPFSEGPTYALARRSWAMASDDQGNVQPPGGTRREAIPTTPSPQPATPPSVPARRRRGPIAVAVVVVVALVAGGVVFLLLRGGGGTTIRLEFSPHHTTTYRVTSRDRGSSDAAGSRYDTRTDATLDLAVESVDRGGTAATTAAV